jgi:hypothetical protein
MKRVVGLHSYCVRHGNAERLIETASDRCAARSFHLPDGRKLHRTFTEAADAYLEHLASRGGKDIKNKPSASAAGSYFGTDRLTPALRDALRKQQVLARDKKGWIRGEHIDEAMGTLHLGSSE